MSEESLFHEALDRSDPQERAAFLEKACAGRPELRAAVEALLAANEQSGNFLHRPAALALCDEAAPAGETDSLHGHVTENRSAASLADSRKTGPETVDSAAEQAQAAAEPVSADAVGRRIDRYEIRKLLGRGGMGAVYLAHDPDLDRLVALKIPKLSGRDAEERFLREARAAAAVTHPNLCPVYDAGRADGVLFLAMAYVPGAALSELRKDGPMAPQRAAAIALAVARGMAEAHRHGIIHRDLKPGNILFNGRGEPVVTDFGLAFRANIAAAQPDAEPAPTIDHDSRLTQSGVLMGTPAYMPPEQARGDLERIGPASDVYALGAILFELLTGRQPIAPAPLREMVQHIETQPVPAPSTIRRGVAPGLDAICRRALAKDPADRFASMDEIADALAPFAAPQRSWRRLVAAAAACFVLIAAAVVFYVQTDNGTIEIRLNDPAAKVLVSVDGNAVQLTESGRVTKLRAGPHGLEVKGEGFETQTKLFKVTRGEKTIVEVELKPTTRTADATKIGQPAPAPDRTRLGGLLAQGRKLIAEARYMELDPIANEALAIDPESPGALALRATFRYAIRKDMAGALADAESALKLNPETVQALIIRASLSGAAGKTDDAIADLTIATRLEPKHPAVWSMRSNAYFANKEYRQVVADATRAIELGFQRSDAHLNRGAGHVFLGEHKKALADFDVAVRLAPHEPGALLQRSAIHGKLGNAEQSAADWATAKKLVPNLPDDARPLIPEPPKPPERKKLAPEEAEALAKALEDAETAIPQGRSADARKAIEEALKIDPTSAEVHSIRAYLFLQVRQYDEARTAANEAVRLDPNHARAYDVRGGAKSNKSDSAGAIADFTISIRIDPMLSAAWYHRGNEYYRRGQTSQAISDLTEAIRFRADFGDAFASRGACYLQFGDHQKALADYLHAAELEPTDPQWRRICTALYTKLDNPEEARKQRERAVQIDAKLRDVPDLPLPVPLPPVKRDPESPLTAAPEATAPAMDHAQLAVLLMRGRKLLDQGRYGDLEPVAEAALKIDPESPGALAFRATCRADHDNAAARADANAALKLNPETMQALLIRSYLDSEEDKNDDSIADATIAARLAPGTPTPFVTRSSAYSAKGEYRQAIADASRAIDMKFGPPNALLTRGWSYACLGDYAKALADFDAAAIVASTNPSVFARRSLVYFRMGDTAKAGADRATALKLDKDFPIDNGPVLPARPKPPERKKLSPEQTRELAAALQAAKKAWNLDRFEECRKAAEEAVRIDPTSAAAHTMVAQVWNHQGHNQNAIDEANAALRLDPDHSHAYLERGLARSRLKDTAGAIADYTIALRISETYAIAWNNRGFAYSNRGQYHQAIADLNEAIRLRPNYTNAVTNRGFCYLHLGDYKKARADYETATKLQPTHARWWRVLGLIRARLGDDEGARRDQERAVAIDPQLANAPDRELPVPLPPLKKDPELTQSPSAPSGS